MKKKKRKYSPRYEEEVYVITFREVGGSATFTSEVTPLVTQPKWPVGRIVKTVFTKHIWSCSESHKFVNL